MGRTADAGPGRDQPDEDRPRQHRQDVYYLDLLNDNALIVCAPQRGATNASVQVVVYALLGGIVGAHGVRQCKERGTIYTAGLKVSVVNMAVARSSAGARGG